MDLETRTALVMVQMDADRDRKVSRREFNIWNEMQTQTQNPPGIQTSKHC